MLRNSPNKSFNFKHSALSLTKIESTYPIIVCFETLYKFDIAYQYLCLILSYRRRLILEIRINIYFISNGTIDQLFIYCC